MRRMQSHCASHVFFHGRSYLRTAHPKRKNPAGGTRVKLSDRGIVAGGSLLLSPQRAPSQGRAGGGAAAASRRLPLRAPWRRSKVTSTSTARRRASCCTACWTSCCRSPAARRTPTRWTRCWPARTRSCGTRRHFLVTSRRDCSARRRVTAPGSAAWTPRTRRTAPSAWPRGARRTAGCAFRWGWAGRRLAAVPPPAAARRTRSLRRSASGRHGSGRGHRARRAAAKADGARSSRHFPRGPQPTLKAGTFRVAGASRRPARRTWVCTSWSASRDAKTGRSGCGALLARTR